MAKLDGCAAGLNLGHWISQYGSKSHEHFSRYITEWDIDRIASLGFDHVRVPVDYFIFMDEAGNYLEDGLKYIDSSIAWCKKNGLGYILDLHHAPGFFFGHGDKNDLFTNRERQLRFIGIWKFFAERYADEGNFLVFELLNELVWDTSDPWNALWQETAEEIHKITPERRIIIGGNRWNSINELKNLTVVDNPNIIYNFHSYEPFIFTHQRAGWIASHVAYKKPVTYPFSTADHYDYYGGADMLPELMKNRKTVGYNYMLAYFKPALDFARAHPDKALYCGEFGVIGNAEDGSALRWVKDFTGILNQHGIGHAYWSYRGFARFTDEQNGIVSMELAKALAAK